MSLSIDHDTDRTAAAALRGLLDGRVHLPGDPGYDAARVPWNVAVDQRPAAVAFPRTADEVATVVRAAAESGLRVAPQSTGHNAGPLAARGLDDVVVLRTSEMATAVADPARGIVRVEGGAIWEPAVEAAAAHGKAVLHGSSPDVGIAGYSLGGGIGWYARKLGLATNSLTAVELVLADGTSVRADETTDRELFWAVRGGGGSFGVVTALEFRMYDVPTAYAGMLVWDLTRIEPVLREWAAWGPGAPDEVTTSFRAMRIPPMPDVPEPLRGRRLVIVDGAVLGSDERGEELLAGLRALRPEIDTFARVPAKSLVRLHMDPEGGAPFASDSAMLGSFPDAAVDAFVAEAGPDAQTTLLLAELRQLGGALGRPHPGSGVLSHLEADFLAFAGGIAATPEMGAQAHADAVRLVGALAPFANGRQYLNFAENPVDPRSAYRPEAWTQLAGIRSAVDPHGVFAANHPVPRLFEDGRPTA
ncbi:FAD-binding oxidoreductase [Nocardioides panaciterrulae]|uniref:FAD/FMN-containing dehydrogenase n=1 Tax=Nocardioides panaciterrulae TaxID=661492 RepID=A0A7Y9E502_9ACTN|nr:FAD-binding oxidoreductase [Nocardioides panaciterrulae]NYD41250.1 FAD/FMN-containing dehydrogenase [Nocardioides panaciterrulae]